MIDIEAIRERWAGLTLTYHERQFGQAVRARLMEGGERALDLPLSTEAERGLLRRCAAAPADVRALLGFLDALGELQGCGCQFCEAVDRVEELLPAIARLQQQLDDVMRSGDLEHNRNAALLERCERAEAERDRVIAAAEEGMAALNAALAEAVKRIQRDEAAAALLCGTIQSAANILRSRPTRTAFDDDVIRMLDHTLAERDAGTALLAELAAARALAAQAEELDRWYFDRDPDAEPIDADDLMWPLRERLAAYDAAVKKETP